MAVTDTDAIFNGAKRIDGASEDFGDQLGKLSEAMNGITWGTDAPGAAITQAYGHLLDHAADALPSHHDLLAEAVGKLVAWATQVLETEGANAAELERFEDLLEDR